MTREEFDAVIKDAIQSEIDAANFYRSLQKNVRNDTSKVLLKELENMEWAHKHILEHLDTADIMEYEKIDVPNLKISDSLVAPVEHPEMSVQDIIILAIKREEQAWKRYMELAQSTDNPRIKQLLQRLADEEAKHKLQLETIYDDEGLYEN